MLAFIGTGGVGKTSLSIATALQAAKLGKRVAAITVDPSRRLTSLLGLDSDTGLKKSFEWPDITGSVDIYHVQPTEIFKEFVSKHLGEELYGHIQKNKIYNQISKNLRETHNFAALYKMVEISQMDEYDFIVLDTPPCHQVLDFFESPNRLQKFFTIKEGESSSWISWIQDKSVQVAESFIRPLVGKEFVKEMDHFFKSISSLRKSINGVSTQFLEKFERPTSQLVMVFPPALDKLKEVEFLVGELKSQNYHVGQFVMNRSHVINLDESKEVGIDQDSDEYQLYNYFKGQQSLSQKMLSNLSADLGIDKSTFYYIPEIEQKITSIDDVLSFAHKVGSNWTSL